MSLRQSLSGRAVLSARTPDGSGDVWPSVRKGALQTPRKNTTVAEFIASDKNRSFSTKKKKEGVNLASGASCKLSFSSCSSLPFTSFRDMEAMKALYSCIT